MINMPNSRKREYYNALYIAQSKPNFRPFAELMLDILKKSEVMF